MKTPLNKSEHAELGLKLAVMRDRLQHVSVALCNRYKLPKHDAIKISRVVQRIDSARSSLDDEAWRDLRGEFDTHIYYPSCESREAALPTDAADIDLPPGAADRRHRHRLPLEEFQHASLGAELHKYRSWLQETAVGLKSRYRSKLLAIFRLEQASDQLLAVQLMLDDLAKRDNSGHPHTPAYYSAPTEPAMAGCV